MPMTAQIKQVPCKSYYGTFTLDDVLALSQLPGVGTTAIAWMMTRLKGPAGRAVYIEESAIAEQIGVHPRTVERAYAALQAGGLVSSKLKAKKTFRVLYSPKPGKPAAPDDNNAETCDKSAEIYGKFAVNEPDQDQDQPQAAQAFAPMVETAPKDIDKEEYKETQQADPVPTGGGVQVAKTHDVVFSQNVDQGRKREVIKRLLSVGVSDVVAYQLAKSYQLDRIEQQLTWLPDRPATNKPGLLVKAIKENFAAPAAIAKAAEQKADKEKRTAQKRDQVLTNVKMQIAERLKSPVVRASGEVYAFMNACRSAGRPVPFADEEIPVKIQNGAAAIAERDAKQEAENRRALELVGLCYDDVLESMQ